ncbi:golvesin C-terminal-like domain-containing protein [Chitinophaga sp. RAB17]|uniref:golvesin C-terminal-like domain-containing protein n=1 Tax=Chitinophaga sp. RAB17 TaxID=3233049 RepID=UPI003F92416B
MKIKIFPLSLLAVASLLTGSCRRELLMSDKTSLSGAKLTATAQAGLVTPIPSGYSLAYAEEFNNNALNTSAWYYRETGNYVGGYNKRQNVSVVTQDGIGYLNIAYRNDVDWNNDGVNDISGGGAITSKAFGYGYYEARIKFYNGATGLHESFWTHGLGILTGQTLGTEYKEAGKQDLVPTDNQMIEIDAIELDAAMNHGKTNFWLSKVSESTSGAFNRYDASYMNLDEWINVGFEWLPNTVIYYINGIERFRFSHVTPAYAATQVWLSALANTTWSNGGQPGPDASMKVDYFRYYNKPISANLIGNNSFEFGGGVSSEQVINWVVYDGIYNNSTTDGVRVVADGTAYNGSTYLQQDAKSGVPEITTKQLLDYIPNGTYRLTARVKKTPGMVSARMRAFNTGDAEKYVDIPTSAEWTKIALDNIVVTSNKAVIGFSINGPDGETLKVDDVQLYNKQFGIPEEWSLVIDNMGTGYSESGHWANSSLPGYQGSSTRYSTDGAAYAQWQPNMPNAAYNDVYIYKVVNPASDPNAKIVIKYNGGTTTKYINYTTGSSGWVFLGKYSFAAGTTGYVRNYNNTSGTSARADAVSFTLPGNPPPAL